MLEVVRPRWQSCIVAAPGPSLSVDVAEQVRASGIPVIAVQDAWRRVPFAQVMYGCDPHWWAYNKGTEFQGEKWAPHNVGPSYECNNERAHKEWGVHLVRGANEIGFSLNPEFVNFGDNSGFQSVNLAILFGCERIALVGFDLRKVDGKSHFFGAHPPELRSDESGAVYQRFAERFEQASRLLPSRIEIVNTTKGSALRCFKFQELSTYLSQIGKEVFFEE